MPPQIRPSTAVGIESLFHHEIIPRVACALSELAGPAASYVSDGKQACKKQERLGRQAGRRRADPQISVRQRPRAAGFEPCLFAARDPLDLGANKTFHDDRQIVVKPSFEHGTQHLAGQTNDDVAVLDKPAGKERIKGGADGTVRGI